MQYPDINGPGMHKIRTETKREDLFMKQPNINSYTNSAIRIMKALLVSYLVTGLLLLLIAGLLYRFRLDEGRIQIGIIVTYILSCFTGGFLAGKMMKSRKFLWGVLLGLCYFLVMTLVSLAVNRELQSSSPDLLLHLFCAWGAGCWEGCFPEQRRFRCLHL